LVSTLQVLLAALRLQVAPTLAEAPTLVRELLQFQVRVTRAAHETFGTWREGQHDDLLLALALAGWYAERCPARASFAPQVLTSPFHPERASHLAGLPTGDLAGRAHRLRSQADDKQVLITMPGPPLAQVHYVKAENQNMWDFPAWM
jgi:hypothetical protein